MLFFGWNRPYKRQPPGDEAEGFVEMRPSLAGLNHDNPDPDPTTI